MGSSALLRLYKFMFMRFLLLLSSFYPIILMANSSSSSSSSSSFSMRQPLMCHESESSALIQFKQSFLIDKHASSDPSAYPKVATWKSHEGGEGEGEEEGSRTDCCSWDGVECDMETGNVIGLHLASSCLYGSINFNSTLFNLVHLQILDLSDNHFNYSQIPFSIGQLSSLTSLDLSVSRFSGQIPSELFALSNLVFLDLSRNPLLKLPNPGLRNLVQNLTRLKTLHLSRVDISSTVPNELADLSSLTSLLLKGCGLHGEFPMNIFQLPSLQYINVRYNPNLAGYLPEFQETSSLRRLYLGGTSFSGELPTSIGKLGSLTRLNIQSCNFTGLVPSSLGHLTQLSVLDLSRNSFSGKIPSSLANLTQLTYLSLSKNNFNLGSTLSWLGQQTKLTVLDLCCLDINGEIPSSLVNMSQLTILNFYNNQLSGKIPSWLTNLTELTELDLDENELEGSIPSSLFELVNLEALDLAWNHLSGTVELHMLSKLKNLTELHLSNNRLLLLSHTTSSTINNATTLPKIKILGLGGCNLTKFPDFLQNQDELELLFLYDNKIQGSIPKWMWNVGKETLRVLDLSGNFIIGFDQHPDVLPWSKLHLLRLDYNMMQGPLPIPPSSTFQYSVSGNKLTGEIPRHICDMTSLVLLDLSSNNLSGRIPPCLASFSKSLLVLDLGSNNFNGPIPAETCTMPNNLRVIDLGENQFQGQLPRSLANCVMLEHLVLGNNQIEDNFPSWLGALPHLEVLILRSNRFHGTIRSWDNDLRFPKLRIIDLSNNEFIGDLPSEYFQNWDAMKLTEADNNLQYMEANSTVKMPGGYSVTFPYMYSMKMTNKGMQRFYENIPDIFTAIDLSGNNFGGQIPEASIGRLKGLHLLNLGSNNLTGHIPSSLGNLTQLESLDLSRNKLSGEIPWQLTRMTFLAFFDVSDNNLTGAIPQGQQFSTFSNASFEGNLGLCGSPLSKACGRSSDDDDDDEAVLPPTPSTSDELDWKFVLLMGYGSGIVIGISIGYFLTSWKHEWFVKTFGKRRHRKGRRAKRMG